MIDKIKTGVLKNNESSEPKISSKETPEISSSASKDTELSFALEEMEHVIAYLCRTGGQIDNYDINICVNAKHLYKEQGFLSSTDEIEFWTAYRLVMESIQPATLASIQETSPSKLWMKKNPKVSAKVKRIPFYYGAVVCVLIFVTILLHIYYMIGVDVLKKTHELFNQRAEVRNQISKMQKVDRGIEAWELDELKQREKRLDQEFDANRVLMFRWNAVWQRGSNEASFSVYDEYRYQEEQRRLTEAIKKLEGKPSSMTQEDQLEKLREEFAILERDRQLSTSRYLLFSGRLSATYMINLLEEYVLPLLFGCLGAFTLILRSMHESFSNSTFTLKNCLDYNLRILLGSVIGMSSGMFMGGDAEGAPKVQYSPMVIAFLFGYNVEIMFAIMDNLAQKLMVKNLKNDRNIDRDRGGCKLAGMGGTGNFGDSSKGVRVPGGSGSGSNTMGSRMSVGARTDSMQGSSRGSRMSSMSRSPQQSRMSQSPRITSDYGNSRMSRTAGMSSDFESSRMQRGPQTDSAYGARGPQESRMMPRSSRATPDSGDPRYGRNSEPSMRQGSRMSRDPGESQMPRISRTARDSQESQGVSQRSRIDSDRDNSEISSNIMEDKDLQDTKDYKDSLASENRGNYRSSQRNRNAKDDENSIDAEGSKDIEDSLDADAKKYEKDGRRQKPEDKGQDFEDSPQQ